MNIKTHRDIYICFVGKRQACTILSALCWHEKHFCESSEGI